MTPEEIDPVEELLAECLAADDPAAAVAAAAQVHPGHAAALRSRFDFLVAAGAPGVHGSGAVRGRLGRFQLVEQIGGGGMGVVWRAREEPPGRDVALKLVRPEHLWFGGAHRRFLREMEVLASLSHPGIVPVYSCGEHDGVPFLAMEYVRGRSLAAVLTALRERGGGPDPASLRQPGARDWVDACFRVALQVAEALAYAHERGIVHRDVKPSNVMLDDDGRARLIDFGLARATGSDSMTRTGIQPGSLAYMSPEQVRGEAVDARTDVWSLGATLHELLSLRQPFAGSTEEATRRAILAGVPPQLAAPGTTKVPWDAAIVVAAALAPERSRRYATMAAFAADLAAVIERRPIAARRASPLLRSRRWVQRHPAAAVAAALGVALFVVLPTALLWKERTAREDVAREALRAQAAEAAAKREATTSQRVVTFLQDLFYEVDPWRARGSTVSARVILDRGVQRMRSELQDEPEVRAGLLAAMGRVYLNLGLFGDAEALLREGLDLRERVLHQGGAALLDGRRDLATAVENLGRVEESEALLRLALQELADGSPVERAGLRVRLAFCAWRQDRLDEASRDYDAAVAALEQERGPNDHETLPARLGRGRFLAQRIDVAQGARELAAVRRGFAAILPANHPLLLEVVRDCADAAIDGNQPAAAETDLRQAIDSAAKVFDADHPSLGMLRETLAVALLGLDRSRDALAELDLALRSYATTYPAPHPVLARARNLESTLAWEVGDLPRAAQAARSALRDYEQLFPQGSLDQAMALGNLARVLLMLGNLTEAAELAQRSVAMNESLGQRRKEVLATSLGYLAYAQALTGDLAAAATSAEQAVGLVAAANDTRTAAEVHCYAAEVKVLAGQFDAGLELARAAEREWAANRGRSGMLWARFVQGWAQNSLGRHAEAAELLTETLAQQRKVTSKGHPYLALTMGELAIAKARQRDFAAAEQLLLEAVAIRIDSGGPDNPLLALPLLNLAAVEFRLQKTDEALRHGQQLAGILRINGIRGGRLVDGMVGTMLAIVPTVADPQQRARAFAALRESSEALGATAEHLQAIDKASGQR